MDEYDFAEFNRVKKESEVIDNQLLCDIANKYNVKSIYGFTTSTLFYGAHKNREIYLQIDPFRYLDCYGYNTWIWDVKNVFEMMALTFLHEIGHCYNGDSGDNRNIEERPKNMWDKLKDEKDGEAWRFAFDYRQKNNENYERMVSQFKEMKNNKPLNSTVCEAFSRNSLSLLKVKEYLGDTFNKYLKYIIYDSLNTKIFFVDSINVLDENKSIVRLVEHKNYRKYIATFNERNIIVPTDLLEDNFVKNKKEIYGSIKGKGLIKQGSFYEINEKDIKRINK